MAKADLTADQLHDTFDYNPDTGHFLRRRTSQGRAHAGEIAGYVNSTGYVKIGILGSKYLAHRLAWLYVYGEWPANDIDHIDGCRTNNRIENLRQATRGENLQNQRKAKSHNRTGFLGVREDYRLKKSPRRFIASIVIDGKQRRLGSFYTPEDAYACYLEAKRKHHEMCTI